MATQFTSVLHTFSIDDITATFSGETYADNPSFIDTDGSVTQQIVDKDGNVLSGVDSEFGYYVSDFLLAEQKVLDGDYAEGHAGNILNPENSEEILGVSIKNAVTDIFLSGAPLGTWSLGLGGNTVKASTEHYATMASVLSDQAYPGDPDAIGLLDNDLRLLDRAPTGPDGQLVLGPKHNLYVDELSQALQRAIDNNEAGANPQSYSDIDFDRDGSADEFETLSVAVDYDSDGDGTTEEILVGGVDLDGDGVADIVDSYLNGYGGTADLVDLVTPNEATVTENIAYSQDYSVTLKDDGKLLYRWGTAVKKPNDIRMEVKLDLPEEWTEDQDNNNIADSLEGDHAGFVVTRAELVITHDITNNPNDQVRPEDYENEAAIGRLPSYFVVQDPDDTSNTLWVSTRDSYSGDGKALPSYFALTEAGEIDLTAGGTAVYDPDGALVGYRNTDDLDNPIGTVFRDEKLTAQNASADLDFSTTDLAEGFTAAWYTTTDREPFEWSYDKHPEDPYKQEFDSFRSPEDAAAAGYTEESLVSGPRWRLTPNKFGQDLPGLEVPLEPNSQPPFQNDNIKYDTGEMITTTLNLLDWEDGASPLAHSSGWMLVDPTRLDVNADGVIDEGWSAVNGTLGAGDAMPVGPIYDAVTPNGTNLSADFLDTAIYVKGDRQDSAKIYDMQLEIDYIDDLIGTVQEVSGLDHNEQTISFQQGAMFGSAVVFATPPTLIGKDPATVAVTDVTSSGASLFIKEADYLDGLHAPEDVTLLTLAEGNWSLADGTRLEVGTADIPAGPTETFISVEFEQEFEDTPAVLLQLQTNNGANWAVVRADDVTTTGFDFMLQEEEDSDGYHIAEVLGWAAIDANSTSGLIDWGGVVGQAFQLDNAVDHSGTEFTFDSTLGLDPLLTANMTSYNGVDTATLRLRELSDDGWAATADILVQEERSADDEIRHKLEDVSGIAFADAGLLQGFETPMMDLASDTFDFV